MAGGRSYLSGEEAAPADPLYESKMSLKKAGGLIADMMDYGAAQTLRKAVGASTREEMAAKAMETAGQRLKKTY